MKNIFKILFRNLNDIFITFKPLSEMEKYERFEKENLLTTKDRVLFIKTIDELKYSDLKEKKIILSNGKKIEISLIGSG